MKTRHVATLLALGSVAALPACSWFNGGGSSNRASTPASSYAAAPSYNSSPSAARSTELTPDMVKNVQEKLQQDGIYHGNVDGVWGRGTQGAVRNFQQQHNMEASGQLNQDTLTAMNLGPGQNNEPANGSSNPPPPPNNANNNPPPDNTNQR